MTKGQLYKYFDEANELVSGDHFLAIIPVISQSIKNFLAHYNSEIKTIRTERNELMKQFFVFNEEGKIKMQRESEMHAWDPILLPGKTVEEWNKRLSDWEAEIVPEKLKLVGANGKKLVN